MSLDEIFNHLMFRAKHEKCVVNIYEDTIWLSDCGFGFDDKYFCVNPKGNDDNDKIARWELPKLKFWEKPTMQRQFKQLVKELVQNKEREYRQKAIDELLAKSETARQDVLRLIGVNTEL